jgi:beta-1,4-mannosyl-glycoprotein beta-1,4-N-acetylglucosaminyltransferase
MLVDTFMFYNEFDILELRLEVLDRYVDRFVLVEAEVNHVGGTKPLYFQENKDRYAKWLHKIEHVVVRADEAPKDESPWAREKFQRECVLRGLEGVPNSAVIMISDVDEIPDINKIHFEHLPHVVCSAHMWMFEYSLDYLFTGEPWFGTVITNCEIFKRVGPNYLRDNRWKFPCFKEAGWHLSSFGKAGHIRNKMATYAHAKDKTHRIEDEQTYNYWIEKGIHIDGSTPLIPRPEDVALPAPVEVLRRLSLGKFP